MNNWQAGDGKPGPAYNLSMEVHLPRYLGEEDIKCLSIYIGGRRKGMFNT